MSYLTDPIIYDENGERDWGDYTSRAMEVDVMESDIMQQLLGKYNKYGESMYGLIMASDAGCFHVEDMGGNEYLAKMIQYGVYMANPVFDETGKRFLQDRVEGFSFPEYGVELMRTVLRQIKSDLKPVIFEGIRQVLSGECEMVEAKFVKFYKELSEYSLQLENSIVASMAKQFLFEDTMEHYHNGEPLKIYRTDYLQKKVDKGRTTWREVKEKTPYGYEIMNRAYEYFMEKYDKIPENFKEDFKGCGKEKMVAYYVATRPESGLESLFGGEI